MNSNIDHSAMSAALEEARLAGQHDEVPIGAVLVDSRTGNIVARAGNRTITESDPTAHAEILVIRALCKKLGVQRLPEYDLYVTLEPCPMCAAAISFARIRTIHYGAADPKSGAITPQNINLYNFPQLHHSPNVKGGILKEDCGHILKDFFAKKRVKNP